MKIKHINKKYLCSLAVVSIISFLMTFLFIHKSFYAGDAYAIKLTSNNLRAENHLGISYERRDELHGFLDNKDQYFFENDSKQRFYQRWGVLNPLLVAIPDLFSKSTDDLFISQNQVFRHGLYNAILSTLVAMGLFLIIQRFAKNHILSTSLSLCFMYSSFIWHYLLAQSYELFQLLFFIFYVISLYLYKTYRTESFRICLSLSLILLVFTKSVFFLVALPGILYVCDYRLSEFIKLKREIVLLALMVLAFLVLQNYFFTENFPIRTAHPHDPTVKDFSLNHIIPRFKEYFLSFNKGMFFYFPPFIFSIFYWKRFYKEFRSEAIFIASTFLLFSFAALSFHIYGDWCFGPRYYIFILPFMSLPCLYIFKSRSKIRYVFVLVSIIYTFLQFQYEQMGFHFSYHVEGAFKNQKIVTDDFSKHKLFVSYQMHRYYRTGEHPSLDKAIEQQVSGINYNNLKRNLDLYRCDLFFEWLCL